MCPGFPEDAKRRILNQHQSEQGGDPQGLTGFFVDESSHLLLSDKMGSPRCMIRSTKETQQHHQAKGKGFHPPTYSSEMENPIARAPPSLGLLRVKEMKQERPPRGLHPEIAKAF